MQACTLMDLFLTKELTATPVDTNTLIRHGKNAKIIAQITRLALEAFQKGELKQFDALVGEEACQLRAKKILDLYKSKETLSNEITKVIEESKRADALFQVKKLVKKISFEEAFGSHHLIVSDNIRFIVLAYLLTQTKKEIQFHDRFYHIKDRTDLEWLQKNYELTQSQAKKIRETAEVQLASLSCDYILSLKENLPEREFEGKRCVPCFPSIQVLLESMIQNKQKFLIEVKLGNNERESCGKIQLLYAPNPEKTGFEQLQIDSQSPKTPLIVFAGNSLNENHKNDTIELFKKQIGEYNPEELILANSAQHSSYPGRVEDMSLLTEERQKYIDFADKEGCKPDNMRLFCLDHIYPSTLEKELKQC